VAASHTVARSLLGPIVAAGAFALAVQLGGCLTAMTPRMHAGPHHGAISSRTPDMMCLGCHEAELDAKQRLDAMPAPARAHAMHHMEMQGGASLVAQWMIDDPRGCLGCHDAPWRPG
jgi:hypothetical protein